MQHAGQINSVPATRTDCCIGVIFPVKNDAAESARSYPRLLRPPNQSFFLFGMRGVGKSTWALVAFPRAHRFDLLDEGLFQSYLRDIRLFGRELLRLSKE